MKLRNILLGATIMFGFALPAFAQGAMPPPPPPNGAGHFDMAVSYTHLDVYKRQTYIRW